jgi:peptidyl-prolyl cis-trans isomerase D
MFDSIRNHQRVLLFVLVLLIFPAFAFFGIQGYDQFLAGDRSPAKVGDSKITPQEFDLARQQQLDQMRRMFGDRIDPSLLDSGAMRAEVLEGLITQRALLNEAQAQRIAISNDALRRTILEIPELLGPDGRFDKDRYRAQLAAQGRSEVAFEAELRRDLTLQALPAAISETLSLPDSVVDRVTRIGEQRREIRQRNFAAGDYADRVDVSDDALKRYHSERATDFQTAESVRVEYLVLEPSTIEQAIKLDPDAVRAYFEQNKARYALPEQRKASHILIQLPDGADDGARKVAREKAQGLLDRIRAGADFAAIARVESQDPGSAPAGGDLGWFDVGMMVKPFSEAAFRLAVGATSDLVETEFGYHIIRVSDIRPGRDPGFEAARADVESAIRKQQLALKFAEAAETFSNLVYEQADTFEPAAARFGIKVESAGDVGRGGAVSLGADHPLNQPRVLQALFSADSIASKRNIAAIEVSGKLVSARVLEHRPSRAQTFDEVREQVREQVLASGSDRLAREAADGVLRELAAGKAAGDSGFGEPRVIGRTSPDLPQEALEQVFRLDSAKLPARVVTALAQGGYALVELLSVTEAEESLVAERKPVYRRQLEQAYGQAAMSAYLESVKDRTRITRNLQAISPGTGPDR